MTEMLIELLKLLVVDAVFFGLCFLAILPLWLYRKAAFAILKRNFVGYFMNPTGYVFLCLFVVLTSLAAFWPHQFFAANLASLHQLNLYLPYIMLMFIPAITMSIWSEERRQGTDELLLTLPADDFDVVIGKYLAAAAIYSFSLLFSQVSHYAVLVALTLGNMDTGLLCSTYFGYWLTGLAMISVGMVASFLTRNLTVGFILGALFNAPLVFFNFADVIIPWSGLAHVVSQWSIAAKFEDFGRGVISLSSVTYFVMIIVTGLYLSMALIGSRHWWGGRDGTSLIGHYFARTASLVVIAIALVVTFSYHDRRQDVSSGRVSSLAPDTLRLLDNLKPSSPVYIEAFISANVPEEYMQTQYDLRSLLKEFASKSPKIKLRIHDNIEVHDEEAVLAEQRFNITPVPKQSISRGAIREEPVIMGAAFTCGLEKVTVPFFERGVRVEYELIRSINTVAKKRRLKLGVVRTDAQLFATTNFDPSGQFQPVPQELIIDELQKQYDVEQVDPANQILPGQYDVLMVVQPSSLDPVGLDNLVAAIKAGQPTAIFEDPLPAFVRAPGTGDPRRSPGMMMGMGQPPPPKGEIAKLWDALGIEVPAAPSGFGGPQPYLVWQAFNPYPQLQQLRHFSDFWVFASVQSEGGENSLNQKNSITSELHEVLFMYAGAIKEKRNNDFEFTKLVTTGAQSGILELEQFRRNAQDQAAVQLLENPVGPQTIAALIEGGPSGNADLLEDSKQPKEKTEGDKKKSSGVKVLYVADADVMMSQFLRVRASPEEGDVHWNFENVTFMLNALDFLAGETDYVAIRKHQPKHYTLLQVEEQTQEAIKNETELRKKFNDDCEKAKQQAEVENKNAVDVFKKRVAELQKKQESGDNVEFDELQAALAKAAEQQELADQRKEKETRRLEHVRDRKSNEIRRRKELQIDGIQNTYKMYALFFPPITPLLVGLIVFAKRMLREREGIARSRLVK